MRRTTLWNRVPLLAGAIVAALASGCYTPRPINARPTWADKQAAALQSAGERLGVSVDTETTFNLSQGGATLSTATARSWRTTSATELPRGINFAVAWLDAQENQPAGYYKLRAIAQPRGIGQVDGQIQVIDAAGAVVREVPATFDITSLTSPANADLIAPSIFVEGYPLPPPPAGATGPGCRYCDKICYCCSNGVVVCTHLLFVRCPHPPHVR